MTEPSHIEIIKNGLDTWNEWRKENPRIQPHLQGVDLQEARLKGADLQRADLQGAILKGADLQEAQLEGAKLQGVDLTEADLRKANFLNANLLGTNFRGADLRGADLRGAYVSDAIFSEALLVGVRFHYGSVGLNLGGAEFQGTDLREVNLKGASLQGVNLQKANLIRAKLTEARLQKANLRWAHLGGVDLSEATLRMTDLRNAQMEEAILEKANLEAALLQNAICIKVNFQKAKLERANLHKAELQEANLFRANLKAANLGASNCVRASFKEADLTAADFKEASVQGASFQHANLKGANFNKADLEGADMREANLQGASFDQAILKNIRIDFGTIAHLAPSLVQIWGSSFQLELLQIKDEFLVRFIEFPPEYHQAGLSILNYFGTVLRQKYPDKKVKVRIEQEGLKVTMIVEPEEGDREAIERTLDEYGLVVLNKIPANQLLPNPLHAQALEKQLEIAELELKWAYRDQQLQEKQYEKRIGTLEEDNRWLREHVGKLLLHSGELVGVAKDALRRDQVFLRDMVAQGESIRVELSTLANRLGTLDKVKADIEEVKEILLSIRHKEPRKYEKIKEYFSELATGTTASIYATVICEAVRAIS